MSALPPGSTLGILGGGQVGRMLAMAAARLGIRCCFVSPDADPPAADVALHIRGGYDDPEALRQLAEHADVITYEFENVDVGAAQSLSKTVPLRPSAEALRVAQDRLVEKKALADSGIPTAPFAEVVDASSGVEAVNRWGKCVVKTRRFGYDGKGQVVVTNEARAAAAWDELGQEPAIVEGWVDYACEASVIVARGIDSGLASFDVVRNEHQNNILRRSSVPSGLSAEVEARATALAESIAVKLDYVGVLGVELFVGADGSLCVNEIAPRVHNSGHWTTDACYTSQFEQHVRAVMGWPLGSARRHSDAVMENLIGDEVHDWRRWAAQERTSVHLYRKDEAKPGRKMGHVTRCSSVEPKQPQNLL